MSKVDIIFKADGQGGRRREAGAAFKEVQKQQKWQDVPPPIHSLVIIEVWRQH